MQACIIFINNSWQRLKVAIHRLGPTLITTATTSLWSLPTIKSQSNAKTSSDRAPSKRGTAKNCKISSKPYTSNTPKSKELPTCKAKHWPITMGFNMLNKYINLRWMVRFKTYPPSRILIRDDQANTIRTRSRTIDNHISTWINLMVMRFISRPHRTKIDIRVFKDLTEVPKILKCNTLIRIKVWKYQIKHNYKVSRVLYKIMNRPIIHTRRISHMHNSSMLQINRDHTLFSYKRAKKEYIRQLHQRLNHSTIQT